METSPVNVTDVLNQGMRLFLDSAPVIYYVEQHPRYIDTVAIIFEAIDAGTVEAITSPITLAESLVIPYRLNLVSVQQAFLDVIVQSNHTQCMPIDHGESRLAAELRASYHLSLADALQVAVALRAGCDAFLTNDMGLRRVAEIRMLVLDDLISV